MFEEQARGLLAGGADVLWVETISAAEEFEAAALGIARTGAPWCGTMSFDTAGRTMMGLTSADMVALVAGLAHQPLAFGANCGVGASDLLRTVLGFRAAHPALPVIAKGNAGIPKFVDGHIHYDGTPELMADYAVLARDCGATIIGGCCGTTPAHLAAMRAALETTPRGPGPDLDTIAARLGGFSSASDGLRRRPGRARAPAPPRVSRSGRHVALEIREPGGVHAGHRPGAAAALGADGARARGRARLGVLQAHAGRLPAGVDGQNPVPPRAGGADGDQCLVDDAGRLADLVRPAPPSSRRWRRGRRRRWARR